MCTPAREKGQVKAGQRLHGSSYAGVSLIVKRGFHLEVCRATRLFLPRESWWSVVQDHTEEGIVDLKSAIVSNEAQFPEFVHEKIDPRARGANHFRQHLLRYFGKHLLRLGFLAVASQQ
jgi:hypothetical protein